MQFIYTLDTKEATETMASKIVSFLDEGKNVLWLVPGGSNVPITAAALKIVRSSVSAEILSQLTVAQVDERFGPVGHPDSNWKQLKDTGADLSGFATLPILDGSNLSETVAHYAKK